MNVNDIQKRMKELSTEYTQLESKLEELLNEDWVKEKKCKICETEGYTEWHHIISQHRCKEEGLDHLIRLRNNVIELCQTCHDLTTASLLRKNMPDKKIVSDDNAYSEPTEKQINYIKKLGGNPDGLMLNRKGASQLIDELKNSKSGPTQTS